MADNSGLKTPRLASLAGLAGIAMTAQAQAQVGTICLELPAGAGSVTAEIASGCLPTSPGHEADFEIEVDADQALISISGGFTQIGDARIGTADCMGSQTVTQDATAAGPRRYTVIVNGQYRGTIDASDTMFGMRPVSRCFEGPSQVQRAAVDRMTTYHRRQFAEWVADTHDDAARYNTLGDLTAVLMGNHPESFEGRPSVEVSVSPARWQSMSILRNRDTRFMAIRIEEHGFLDDSVSGRRTFAAAERDPENGQWQLSERWHQIMCARGSRAGMWTALPCP